VKQATINLLADMGVPNPSSFEDPTQINLKLASASTDTTSPTTSPPIVSSTPIDATNSSWTFEGSATDVGGKVAGMEISYDGGATWKRAVTSTPGSFVTWSHSVVLPTSPIPFVLTRAVDDSFNMEAVKAARHAASNTLYVYGGGTSTSGTWDNDLVITKSGSSFTVTNNGNTVFVPSGSVSNIVVQLAIGQNRVKVADPGISPTATRDQVAAAAATVTGSLTIRGGIGKDTILLDHIKIGNGLVIEGDTGADTVNLMTSVVATGNAIVDLRLNGNGSVDSKPVGAVINVNDGYVLSGGLTIGTGAANDQLTLDKMIIFGAPQVATRGGNDRIDRATASPSYSDIQGGDGDDTYVYGTNSMPDTVIEFSSRGIDTFDFSAATSSVTFTLAANFENVRGGSANDALTGNSDQNLLVGNGGNDTLTGGLGNDVYTYEGSPASWGTDTRIDSGGVDRLDYSLATGGISVTLLDVSPIEDVAGSPFDDTINGNNGPNTIYSTGGKDVVTGNGGNDTFIAGVGIVSPGNASTFDGGSGTNSIIARGSTVAYVNGTATGGVLNTQVSTGAKLYTDELNQNSLAISDVNSRVTLTVDGSFANTASVIKSLSIDLGATLDVNDQALIIDYTGASPLNLIRGWIINGRGGAGIGNATWLGTGITSTVAASDPDALAVGYAENSALPLGAYPEFRGVAVDETSILIAYTRSVDTNLNGIVDNDDVTVVGAAYAPGTPNPYWYLGDGDFSGFVDDDDITLLNALYDPSAQPV
jgi:Ca2+-binding RTX toxin-like protein